MSVPADLVEVRRLESVVGEADRGEEVLVDRGHQQLDAALQLDVGAV